MIFVPTGFGRARLAPFATKTLAVCLPFFTGENT